jgi:hypothetical protein
MLCRRARDPLRLRSGQAFAPSEKTAALRMAASKSMSLGFQGLTYGGASLGLSS